MRKLPMQGARLPAARAVGITVGICHALDYIHSCGVVHRDLKPPDGQEPGS